LKSEGLASRNLDTPNPAGFDLSRLDAGALLSSHRGSFEWNKHESPQA
jgi:hypothetical protein